MRYTIFVEGTKNIRDRYEPIYTNEDIANKLGQIEDLMDKYEIKNAKELDIVLDSYFKAVKMITPELLEKIKELAEAQ